MISLEKFQKIEVDDFVKICAYAEKVIGFYIQEAVSFKSGKYGLIPLSTKTHTFDSPSSLEFILLLRKCRDLYKEFDISCRTYNQFLGYGVIIKDVVGSPIQTSIHFIDKVIS